MNNIDKQALRLTAEKAKDNFMPNFMVPTRDVLALLDELEAKDQRIAELEAREVVLPSTQDVHPLGPQSAKIFCEFHRSIVNRCADEIRKVGVKVSIKGN
ncbi:ead/Ea22-like family protein [Enterobacter hormaechei]|nr:ead/Ea22-like family protein [Enterobacter hormaechei]